MRIKQVIRKIIPLGIRKKIYEYQRKILDCLLKRKILSYMKNNAIEDDMKEAYAFLKNNAFSIFPYDFIKKYKHDDILIYNDNDCDMKYVLHEGRRLYFRSDWNKKDIQTYRHTIICFCWSRILIPRIDMKQAILK